MTYIDLMLFRTPGKKLAQLATKSDDALRTAKRVLPELETRGRQLPADTYFGGHVERKNVADEFRNVTHRMRTASESAQRFSLSNTDTAAGSSYYSVTSDAESARTGARRIQNTYTRLPERMDDNITRAVRRSESAVQELEHGNYGSDINRRRLAASNAAADLREGMHAMGDAQEGLSKLLAPFNRHDNLRFQAEYATSSASHYAGKAATMRGISAVAKEKAATISDAVRSIKFDVAGMAPGAATSQLDTRIAEQGDNLVNLVGVARNEPTPKFFAAQVAGAYGATAAVLGGTGYGAYKLSQ